MPQARREGNILSSLRISPEPDAVKRRAALYLTAILAATAAIPAALLVYGYVNQWQPTQRYWFVQAITWFVLTAIYAGWGVYRIIRSSRRNEVVRIDFEPGFLTLVRRFSQERIDCSRIVCMTLVYRPANSGNAGPHVTHRRMRLLLYGEHQPGTMYRLDDDRYDRLAAINGDFLLLSHAAEAIRSRVWTISGHWIEYDEQGDRDSRLLTKQFLMCCSPRSGIAVACMALVITAVVIWCILDVSREAACWKNAVAAKGIVTGFEDDARPKTVHYSYADRDGKSYSGSAPRGGAPEDAVIGDEIDIFHLPNEPEKSVLVLPKKFDLFLLVLFGTCLLLPWLLALSMYFGVIPAVVNGRLVLVGRDELAEDYFPRPLPAV